MLASTLFTKRMSENDWEASFLLPWPSWAEDYSHQWRQQHLGCSVYRLVQLAQIPQLPILPHLYLLDGNLLKDLKVKTSHHKILMLSYSNLPDLITTYIDNKIYFSWLSLLMVGLKIKKFYPFSLLLIKGSLFRTKLYHLSHRWILKFSNILQFSVFSEI